VLVNPTVLSATAATLWLVALTSLVLHFMQKRTDRTVVRLAGFRWTRADFCRGWLITGDTFDFADIDRGKIICVAMPQKFQLERRYVNTFLKMLFYTHALRRFDKPAEERRRDNLLILWADEAQRFVTASEDGMSDYNCIDVIREAQATVVAAAQSSTSFVPPLGRDKARVFTLNLRNRLIFKAADEEGAAESSDFLGKTRMIKKSWGYSAGKRSSNYSEHDEYKIKPHVLRNLPKHAAVVVQCERGYRKRILPPIEPTGKVCSWCR
jgi:type IV secretory pathway TraG/TraD family ATPase VirD4